MTFALRQPIPESDEPRLLRPTPFIESAAPEVVRLTVGTVAVTVHVVMFL